MFFGISVQAANGATSTDELSLVSAVKANWQSDYFSACDKKTGPEALSAAKAMDDRAHELRDYANGRPNTDTTTYFQLGPMVFREEKRAVASTPEWTNDAFGWEKINQKYSNLKGSPIDEKWAALNRDIRAIVAQDKKRLQNNINTEITHASGPFLLSALTVTEACLQDFGCSKPTYDSTTLQFLEGNTLYRAFLSIIGQAKTEPKKIAYIQLLRNRLKIDYDFYFGFTRNLSVNRLSPTEFVLPLDPGPFRGFEHQLEQIISSAWNSSKYHLNIKWTDASANPEVYKIVIHPDEAGNPVTDSHHHLIHLFQGNILRRLAHEVGHVLGFPDHYFDAWNSKACQYMTEIHPGDIMSESKTGIATEEEWQTLDRYYPAQKALPITKVTTALFMK